MERIVKVCGMCEAENIQAVARCGADWMGFIFYEKSPRRFRGEALELPNEIQRVGVFVNASAEEILPIARRFAFHILQLHGEEPPERCAQLREEGFRVMKAISVAHEADIAQAVRYEASVDYFLFDTRCAGYGGSGQSFDWALLQAYTGKVPFLLSGGLRPESLDALRAFQHPRWIGIDLNSGFEIRPGYKDASSLHSFIHAFKRQRQ